MMARPSRSCRITITFIKRTLFTMMMTVPSNSKLDGDDAKRFHPIQPCG